MKEYSLDYFIGRPWSFVLIKKGKLIYRSKKQGLAPLVFCLKYKKNILHGAIVYDKIIGRAAACLIIYGKAKKVMTPVISQSAITIFKKHEIPAEYIKITGKILNKKGDDQCPMEKMSSGKSAKEFACLLINKKSFK